MAVFGIIFVGEIEQKQAIWCLNRKSLNINLLFTELLYKIMLIFELKQHSSCNFNDMKGYIYTFSAPIS